MNFPENDMSVIDKRRRNNRLYQKRHRQKDRSMVQELEDRISQLGTDISNLEKTIVQLMMEESKQERNHVQAMIHRFHFLFSTFENQSSILTSKQHEFIHQHMRSDFVYMENFNKDEWIAQMNKFNKYFDQHFFDLKCIHVEGERGEVAVSEIELSLCLNRESFRSVFPRLSEIEHQHLFGQVLRVRGKYIFTLDRRKICRFDIELDLFESWSQLLNDNIKLSCDVVAQSRLLPRRTAICKLD